jgi:hypothetical protein
MVKSNDGWVDAHIRSPRLQLIAGILCLDSANKVDKRDRDIGRGESVFGEKEAEVSFRFIRVSDGKGDIGPGIGHGYRHSILPNLELCADVIEDVCRERRGRNCKCDTCGNTPTEDPQFCIFRAKAPTPEAYTVSFINEDEP